MRIAVLEDCMPDKNAVKEFVQHVLGCTCPEEVFYNIEFERCMRIPPCRSPITRIAVGGRLLVYILEADQADFVRHDLPVVLREGRRERNTKGFNRLRTVVATKDKGLIQSVAEEVFAGHEGLDEKIHLHIIDAGEVIL